MTTSSTRLEHARSRLTPVFARAAEGVLAREQHHELPRELVRELAAAGFGRLRVPETHGGDGLTIPELAELLVDLATADPNLPQIFRGHLAYVEHVLSAPAGPHRDTWLSRFAAGEIVGNAWSETGTAALGTHTTTLGHRNGTWLLTGRKYYTTGSIFADWIDVTAGRDGEDVTVLVRADQPGVAISDDWDGFGQQLTGTGTIVFDGAEVDGAEIAEFGSRFRYQTAFYQLVLLSVLAGIAAAAERDLGAHLRDRVRVYSHGNAPLARNDPQNLAVAGEVSAIAFAARSLVLTLAAAVQQAYETTVAGRDSPEDKAANALAEIRSAQVQTILSESVPRAATVVFNALGASATSRTAGLDAHWRNARTVASHNPVIYKTRIVGDWSVNAAVPTPIWAIGVDPRSQADPVPSGHATPPGPAAPPALTTPAAPAEPKEP